MCYIDCVIDCKDSAFVVIFQHLTFGYMVGDFQWSLHNYYQIKYSPLDKGSRY